MPIEGLESRDRLHQLRGLHPKCMSKSDDVEQSDVAFAALNPPDIVSVQVRQLRESLLRKAALHPQFADALAE